MPQLSTIYDYLRAHACLLGDRILQQYPALHMLVIQFPPGLRDCCEDLFLHKPSRSWVLPSAGSRRGRAWWSPNVAQERH